MGEANGVTLHEADTARLARLVPAAPAVAATALRATRLAGGGAETARLIVEGVARAVKGGGLPAPEPEINGHYDPALVNADADLAALEAELLRPDAPRADLLERICSGNTIPAATLREAIAAGAPPPAKRKGAKVHSNRQSDWLA
jgi:hypothetical protein